MEPAIVQLAPVLDLIAASTLAAQILPYRGHPLRIDASQVQRLGGQCLQVLLSAEHTWQGDGAAFAIESPSDRFLADWRLFGAPDFTANPPLMPTESLL